MKYLPTLLLATALGGVLAPVGPLAMAVPAVAFQPARESAVLEGYSVVSYLDRGVAEPGSPAISTIHDGQRYLFTDEAQRDAFLADPAKYLPAFGEHCAYGLAKGVTVPVNPRTFKVVGGRTLLFLNDGETNTLDLWNKEDEQRLLADADANQARLQQEHSLRHHNLPDMGPRVALQGHSPVSYFTKGKAVKGSPAHAVSHKGVTYHLASAEEAAAFKADPSRFEPAFGGWCATGMMLEQKFPVDPASFKIVDGQLFLFKNDGEVDALAAWNQGNEGEQVARAMAYWSRLLEE
jgi:YHS domain-containing protein